MRWTSLISSGHSTQMQKITPSFFSSAHGTFSRIDHILVHKSNLSKFKKLKSYQASSTTRYQLQEKNCKKPKHVEIKQHISK